MTHTNLISYTSPRGKTVTTDVKSAIESYKTDTARIAGGQWVDKRGYKALSDALAANNIDPYVYNISEADELGKTAKPVTDNYPRARWSYSAEVDAAGDINNLLSANGNRAAAE